MQKHHPGGPGHREGVSAETQCAMMMGRIEDLEAALWTALDGREVVVRDDTPRDLEWHTTADGGRLVRRAVR